MANLVRGDLVTWTEGVFEGSFCSPKYVGDRTVAGVIEKSCYGSETTAHWLTIRVESSEGVQPVAVGKALRRKAGTVYKGLIETMPGVDHAAGLAEKRGQKLAAAERTDDPIRREILREQAAVA